MISRQLVSVRSNAESDEEFEGYVESFWSQPNVRLQKIIQWKILQIIRIKGGKMGGESEMQIYCMHVKLKLWKQKCHWLERMQRA